VGDEIDRAQARDEYFRETALAEHFRRGIRNSMDTTAAVNCEGCGREIPEPRRIVMPGCRFCVRCQEQHELLSHWRTA